MKIQYIENEFTFLQPKPCSHVLICDHTLQGDMVW